MIPTALIGPLTEIMQSEKFQEKINPIKKGAKIAEAGISIFSMMAEQAARRDNLNRYKQRQMDQGNTDFRFASTANADVNPFGDETLNSMIGNDLLSGAGNGIGFEEAGMRYEQGGLIKDGFIEIDLDSDQIEEAKALGIDVEFL